jgi:DNA polymerase
LLLAGDVDSLKMAFGNIPSVLSELIRTAFIAPRDHTFVVADFSAIEARVIAWLADETWVLDVFKTHGKIYEATAANMFKVPIEEVTKGSPLRGRGKVATLALGYQGGVNALTAMDVKREIPEEDKPGLVARWRSANPHIVRLWYEIDKAAIRAVREATTVTIRHGVTFIGGRGMLLVKLPSGRKLSYVRPRLVTNKFGRESLQYEGLDQTKKTWGKVDTYGGKLSENITQAIARDCLAEAMLALHHGGYQIAMHVHDEVVVEVPKDKADLEKVCRIMGQELPWAKGLPLRADGYVTDYYRKD